MFTLPPLAPLTAFVEEEKCTGCKKCIRMCPSGAIDYVEKKAAVDSSRCISCVKCVDYCPDAAITLIPRIEPLVFEEPNLKEFDEERIREVCRAARFHPDERICLCSKALAKEVAAVILSGARSPEEVSRLTGVKQGCGLECHMPVQRLLKAAGVDLVPPKDGRWYRIDVNLWDIPEETTRKYPMFFLEEDQELLEQGILDHLGTIY